MRDFAGGPSIRHPDRDVAITGVDAAVVEGNFDWNLVRVRTDADVSGLGEAYRGAGIPSLLEHCGRLLEGENPLDVERLVRHLIQATSGHGGTTGKVVSAVSGIEIALWDVAGKLLDVPVYQLLGGKYRDTVRVYADCHAGEAYALSAGAHEPAAPEAYEPSAYAETAAHVRDLGFGALKFDLDQPHLDNDPDPYNGRLTPSALRRKVETVEAVREAVGPDVEVAFDVHWDYTVDSAKRLARALEPYDLLWLEDPVPPENAAAHREVARSTSTPIATGENRFRVHGFRELLDEYGLDIVTPDPTTCGGLAESKAIASRAEERSVACSPHNVCSPVGTMACVHLGASVANFDLLEYHALEVEWWEDLLVADEPLIVDGVIEVPEEPGLGVDLDEAVAGDHAAGGTPLWS